MAKMINVEVAYALPDEQTLLKIQVDENTTVEEAIQTSGILNKYPEIDLKKNKVGIFGKATRL